MDYLGSITEGLAELGLTTGTLLVAALVLIVMYNWPVWDRHLYPPGPLPLPFFGHTLWLARQRYSWKSIHELRKQYGDIITFDLMRGKKLVVLNSPEAHWEGFIKHADKLAERSNDGQGFFASLGVNGSGLGLNEGKWKLTRKHMTTVFREHGIGGRGIEPLILEEAFHLHKALDNTKSEPFDIHDLLTQATCNVITTVTMGSRYDYSDERLENIQLAEYIGFQFRARLAPVVKYLPSYKQSLEKAKSGVRFVMDQIKRHQEDIDYDSPPRDYTDSYLIKIKEHEAELNNEAESDNKFNESLLIGDVLSLYLAGTDTTSESLYWAFVYMIIFPDVQEKIYQEMKQNIGERNPSYADRHLLPYSTAVTIELLRVAPVSSGSLFYESDHDLHILGHRIPRGTLIAANKLPILHNEDFYPEPEKFKPERFLNEKGEFIVLEKKMIPFFGLGRRSCVGEHLARSEHFIFLTSTIQKYRLELGQSDTPSLIAKRKLVMACQSYKIRAIPRVP